MRGFGIMVLVVGIFVLALWVAITWYLKVDYVQNCGGHLKRAADANTIELAKQELNVALGWMEAEGLTEGSTYVFYATPNEDIGFWHTNTASSVKELESVNPEATQLEKTNVLMKLLETLLDHDNNGDEVTAPPGISRYPHNTGFAILLIVGMVMAIVGAIIWWYEDIF